MKPKTETETSTLFSKHMNVEYAKYRETTYSNANIHTRIKESYPDIGHVRYIAVKPHFKTC